MNVGRMIYTQDVDSLGTLSLNSTTQNGTLDDFTFINGTHSLVINLMLMILSLLGNVYIIIFICKQKRARNAHNIGLVSVAVADLLICLVVIPFSLTVHNYPAGTYPPSQTSLSPYLCKISNYIFYWCKTVKIYSVVAMAIDRYYRITMPTMNANMSGRCIFFLTLVWFLGSALNVWQLLLSTSAVRRFAEHNVSVSVCVPAPQYRALQTGYHVTSFVVTYCLPLVTLIYCYSSILVTYLSQADCLFPSKSRRRLLLSVVSALLFYACLLPGELFEWWGAGSLGEFTMGCVLQTVAFSHGLLSVTCYLCCSADLSCVSPCHHPQAQLPPTSSSGRDIQILVTSGSAERLRR